MKQESLYLGTMLRLLLILPLCLWLTWVSALNLDSLWGVWNDKTQPNTNRLQAMQKIAWNGYLFSQPDSAFYFAGLEYRLAESEGNKKWMAEALTTQGITFFLQGNYNQALSYFQKSLKLKEEIGDKQGIASSYSNISSIYHDQGNNEQALVYLQKGLKINEEMGNKKGIGYSYNNIGMVLRDQGNYELALSYFQNGLLINEEIGDKQGMASLYLNIGFMYELQGNYDQAWSYFQKSLILKKEIGDKRGMASSYINLGLLSLKQENYIKSLSYGEKALVLAQEVGVVIETKDASDLLYKGYKKTEQPAKALEMHELYIEMRDSLNSIENKEAAIKMKYQNKYEREEAVKEAKHQKEMERQELISKGVGGGLVLVLVFVFLILNRFRITKKQKEIIQQKNRHITESINYAKRIQEASLSSREYLDSIFDDYFIYYQPRDIVSGDFYWVHEIDKDRVMVAVCDCTGHGVPGAFMSIISNSLLNEIVIEDGITQVDQVLSHLRSRLIKDMHQDKGKNEVLDGLDMTLILLDKKKNTMQFAAAGQTLYIARNGVVLETKGDPYPVGYFFGKQNPFSHQEIILEKGDVLYMSSDGYTDQFGRRDKTLFGYKQFKKLLGSMQDKTMKEQKTILENTILKWKGNTGQVDDILVMGLRF